ncbi:MAG: hypothetical protein JNL11_19560 [Bdellovibrionaceae bacterium]|nr:hypothetical protein [Pseudobdellovibrionaceae bacterium]
MKSLILIALLSAAPLAQAAVVDIWELTQTKVSQSIVKKADGTTMAIDPSQEVVLGLQFRSKAHYGSGKVRAVNSRHVVLPTNTEPGTIAVVIQTDIEHQCYESVSGGLGIIGAVGPDHASVPVIVKPGQYRLIVDSIVFGLATVTESSATVEPDADYIKLSQARLSVETAKIFGDIQNLSIKGQDCEITTKIENNELLVVYSFPSTQSTDSNGDIHIRKAVEGTTKLTSMWTSSSCDRGGEEVSWKADLRGEPSATLKIEKRILRKNEYVYRMFSIGQKSCSSRQ